MGKLKNAGFEGNTLQEVMYDFFMKRPSDVPVTAFAKQYGISGSYVCYCANKYGFQKDLRRRSFQAEKENCRIVERLIKLGYPEAEDSAIVAIARFIHNEMVLNRSAIKQCAHLLRVSPDVVAFYIARAKEVPIYSWFMKGGSEEIKKKTMRLPLSGFMAEQSAP